MDWDALRQLQHAGDFIGTVTYVPTLFVVVALFWWAGMPTAWFPVTPLLALILHPPVVAGVALLCVIMMYEQLLRLSRRLNDPLGYVLVRASHFLLKTNDRGCELLENPLLAKAILVAHRLRELLLAIERPVGGLNASRTFVDEAEHALAAAQVGRLARICEFVNVAGAEYRSEPESVDAVIATIPAEYKVLRGIIASTHADGPGMLSTMSAAYLAHFTLGLPPALQLEVLASLRDICQDHTELGWVSMRVFQTCVDMVVVGRASRTTISDVLSPIVSGTRKRIRGASAVDEVNGHKFAARATLLRIQRGWP